MIYNYVSAKYVFHLLIDEFGVESGDWVERANEWVAIAMGKIGVYPTLQLTYEDIEVENYIAKLPCHTKALEGISHNGERLYNAETINATTHCDSYVDSEKSYTFSSIGVITLPFEEGTIRVHYKTLPLDCDGFPLIPDDEWVIEAIQWYILRNLFNRGFKHETLSIKDAYSNWERFRKKARSSVYAPDKDQMKAMSDTWNTFLYDRYAWNRKFFKYDKEKTCNLESSNITKSSSQYYNIVFISNVSNTVLAIEGNVYNFDTSTQLIIPKPNGTYDYTATASGYGTLSGTVKIFNIPVTKNLVFS